MEFKENITNGGALHFYSPTKRVAQSAPHPIATRISRNKRISNRMTFFAVTGSKLHGGSVEQ
jgi:hypothetical protein